MVTKLRRFADRLVYGGIERNDPPDELASNRLRIRPLRTACRQRARKSTYDFRGQGCQLQSQSTPRAAEISQSENNSSTDNPDADRARPVNGQHESLRARTTRGSKLVTRYDGGCITCERGRVGGEIAQQRRDQSAPGAPQRKGNEERSAVLNEAACQYHDDGRTHHRDNHPEPTFAERCAQARLTDNPRGCSRPIRAVNLQPEGDVERKTHGRGQSQAKDQSWNRSTRCSSQCLRIKHHAQATRRVLHPGSQSIHGEFSPSCFDPRGGSSAQRAAP